VLELAVLEEKEGAKDASSGLIRRLPSLEYWAVLATSGSHRM
jgi:hypothetical protein